MVSSLDESTCHHSHEGWQVSDAVICQKVMTTGRNCIRHLQSSDCRQNSSWSTSCCYQWATEPSTGTEYYKCIKWPTLLVCRLDEEASLYTTDQAKCSTNNQTIPFMTYKPLWNLTSILKCISFRLLLTNARIIFGLWCYTNGVLTYLHWR